MKIMKIIISNVTFLIWNIIIVSRKKFCINDFRIKIWVHSVLLPWLFSFYSFFLNDALADLLREFGFSCPYEHAFFPYFEYCFIFFLLLIYFRLYISMLIIQKKKCIFFFILYLSLFILFLVVCDWYSHYQYIWDVTSQKYMYKMNFNIAGATIIFSICLISLLILDLFIFLFYFYPIISTILFVFSVFFFIFFDLSYLDLDTIFHKLIVNIFNSTKKCFSAECMYSGADLPDEKTVNLSSTAETKSEAIPKTVLQRAAEHYGDYTVNQSRHECKEEGISLRYTPTAEGCRISLVQCLPDPRIPESVDVAINNNLPTNNYILKKTTDRAIGDVIRNASQHGIESSLDLKEVRCHEIYSTILKSLTEYKK